MQHTASTYKFSINLRWKSYEKSVKMEHSNFLSIIQTLRHNYSSSFRKISYVNNLLDKWYRLALKLFNKIFFSKIQFFKNQCFTTCPKIIYSKRSWKIENFSFLRQSLNRCSFRDNCVWNLNLCSCFRCNTRTF
jgi:hypothetical protein